MLSISNPTEWSSDQSPNLGEGPAPDFVLGEGWDPPLWRSLLASLADRISPERLPPLNLLSRPVAVGMLVGDRLRAPWFRTVFTNIGDVISPESLPPLELDSRPMDVGELIGDQLSHLWFSSFLRNLADVVSPERQVPLQLMSKPDDSVLPAATMLLPRWSSVIDGPKYFLPDAPKPAYVPGPGRPAATPPPIPKPPQDVLQFLHDMNSDLRRDLRGSRLRVRIWISVAAAQVVFLLGAMFWPR